MHYFVTEINQSGTVAVDDTILAKGYETKAGSHILDGFTPLFNADIIDRLSSSGFSVYGKTNTGEFGLDLVGETSYFGACRKIDNTLSSAASEVVANKIVDYALCVDVNGTPRRGAALSGVDFIKPTYGTVSRYGIIPTACSGEQIGVCSRNAADVLEMLTIISGHDPKDGTSLPTKKYEYTLDMNIPAMNIGIIKELYDAADDLTTEKINLFAEKIKASGGIVEFVSIPNIKAYATAWQIMMSAETCNNISRYDGVKYGYRAKDYKDIEELYVNTRTEGMGITSKMNVLYGSYVLSKNHYLENYDKSLRLRRLASEEMKAIFAKYNALIGPAMSETVLHDYDISETFIRVKKEQLFTAVPNLIGIPAMVTEGIQLWGPAFGESVLLSIASTIERMSNE